MTPPPAMTTSALSTELREFRLARDLHHPRDLEDQLARGERGDVAGVEGRRNLGHVEADQPRALGGGPQQLQRLAGGQAGARWNLGARGERGVEHVDVEGDMHLLAREPGPDLARGATEVTRDLGRRNEQDAVRGDELELFRVVVATARDHDPRGLDTGRLQRTAQGAPARPAASPREVAQVWMRINPQHREAGMPSDLGRQGRDRRAVVAPEDGQKGLGRHLAEPLHRAHPPGFDVRAGIEVAKVLDAEARQQVAFLGHGRHRGGQLPDALGSLRRASAVDSRAVVGDPRHDNVGRATHESAPWAQAIQVHTTLLSGTFRMLSDPATNQTTKIPKTTGKPPGRPRMGAPRLNRSSSGPPTATAMIPAPAVAMFEKPM